MLRSSHVITPVSRIRQAHLLSTFVCRSSFVEARPSKFVRGSLSDFACLSLFAESLLVEVRPSKVVRPKFVRRSSFVGTLSSELVRRNSFVEVRPSSEFPGFESSSIPFSTSFSIKTWSWERFWAVFGDLGAILGGLGAVLDGLEALVGGLGAILVRSGPVLGRSCGGLGRS